jgi:phosphonate transport system substrate-binding protein
LPRSALAGTLHIGSIESKEPVAEIKKFSPLANYLALHLRSEGIDKGTVIVAKSIQQMAGFLREGKVDLYIDSPFPTVAVSRVSGSKFLLRRWKKGIAEYHSVIFTKKESGINRLQDLNGKTIAFEEHYSSSGYFLPKLSLMQEGLRLVQKDDASEMIPPGQIGYVFSYDDENTMVWVLRGKVWAGAIDNHAFQRQAGKSLNALTILHKSVSIPRQIVSYRKDLPGKLVARIKEILVGMDQSDQGRKALEDFERTAKFDELLDHTMAPLLNAGKFIDVELGVQ